MNGSPTERLGCNDNGSTPTLLEFMNGIRPRRALVQIMGDQIKPAVSFSIEKESAEQGVKLHNCKQHYTISTKMFPCA